MSGAIDTEPRDIDAKPRKPHGRSNKRALLIVAVTAIVAFAYVQGTFDNFLWRVHLNYNDCATNAFGATFCGDGLKHYEKVFGIEDDQ